MMAKFMKNNSADKTRYGAWSETCWIPHQRCFRYRRISKLMGLGHGILYPIQIVAEMVTFKLMVCDVIYPFEDVLYGV